MKFLILITILLLIINIVSSIDDNEINTRQNELAEYGRNMSKYMDRNVDPCDDFYRYSCGNWYKYHKIPNGKSKISERDELNNIYIQQLHEILNAATEIPTNERFELAKNYYLSCTETDILEKRDVHEIKEFIKRQGGMPFIHSDWKESDFNVTKTLLNLKKEYNIDILIGLTFSNDYRNHGNRILYVGETPLSPIPRNYYFDVKHKSKVEKYRALMSKFLQKLGIDYEKSEALSKKFLAFEKDILKGALVDITTALKVRTVRDLSKEHYISSDQKYFNFFQYIERVLGFVIPDTTEIIETNYHYIKNVLDVIRRTDNKSLANYIMYKVAEIFMYENFDKNGKLIKGYHRIKYCVHQTMKFFPQITSQMYFYKYRNLAQFSELDLFTHLKRSFIPYLSMSQAQKINNIKIDFLKYDKKELNEHQITNHNNITDQEYFKNTKAMMQFYANHWPDQWHRRNKNEMDKFDIKPLEINVYYMSISHRENIVLVPVTLLQSPFYNSKYPKAINFARLGIYLARALTHVNENFTQSKYAFENDFLKNWWKQDDDIAINHLGGITDDKIKCYQDQIQHSELAENIPEDESFAVTNSVQAAFMAYLNYLKDLNPNTDKGREILKNETLFGLDLTNTQLFFVAYAQNWCKANRKKDDKLHIYTSMANFKEFATEFRCPEGSWMRPKNVCSGYIHS